MPIAETAAADGAAAEKRATILGSPVTDWKMDGINGPKDDHTVGDVDGRLALSAGPNGLVLTRLTKIEGDAEVTVRFRCTSPKALGTSFYIDGGLKSPDDAAEGPLILKLTVPQGADRNEMYWTIPGGPGRKYKSHNYVVKRLPENRQLWPEMVRSQVESDIGSLPPLDKRWLTVRYVLRKNHVRIELDGRLLESSDDPKIDTAGFFRLRVYHGVQLASVRVRPLPPRDRRFEPIPIEQYLNASQIRGAAVKLESFPKTGDSVPVGGIPFAFPAPDERGNNHIDLKPSWLRAGLVEGYIDGWTSPESRWRGALDLDPSRIQIRVPGADFRNLHLVALADGEADTTPRITAQFSRTSSGHPVTFTTPVPLFTAQPTDVKSLPIQLANGQTGLAYLVTIPLEPESLASLAIDEVIELELTKDVRTYRAFPDPVVYSQHQAGLPSGVHVFAMTLERPAVEIDFQPDKFAHIWTAPLKPGYTVKLRNQTAANQDIDLELSTQSHDGLENTLQKRGVQMAPGAEQAVQIPIELKKFGFHRVVLRVKDSAGIRTRTRSLAFLHPDTRERGQWEEGKGPIFGFWDWGGGHDTPAGLGRLQVMAEAGIESSGRSFHDKLSETKDAFSVEEKAFIESKGMLTFFHAYQLSMGKHSLGIDWDPSRPAEMQAALIQTLKKSPLVKESKINKPDLAIFFGEPVIGPISYSSLPEYFGEPEYKMTDAEQANYQNYLAQFVTAAAAIKKEWPQVKCLLPWGLPLFPVPFLRNSKEATALMDGPALDVVLFERLPEMQLHQVTLSSQLWQLQQEWKKTGKPWPRLMAIEGPAISPAAPGALTVDQEADHTIRAMLVLAAYGTTRHLGWPTPFACAGDWGETHYGSGLCDPMPLLSPKVCYSAFATMTRHLNRMNFVKTIPTGSHSVFCLQFKHYKTGELLHIFWTLRGTRPVTLAVAAGTKLTVFNQMDNVAAVDEKGENATFLASSAPCYVHGLAADPKVLLGLPDHSDAKPAETAAALAELGDGTWKLSADRDDDYEVSHIEFVRRFPGKMSIQPVAVPEHQNAKALAVHLEKQERERKVMPFYATLIPPKPMLIPGKGSHLGLWVKANSDWGRMVYCLRDAANERWISVGKKDEWNCDDVHCWSAFCFDGWRYLRFELPSNSPYDSYREAGSTWWGNYGPGDGVVDLPLTLEKIIVERRTHVIAPTELQPAAEDDVLLAGLFAEYETPLDKTDEAIRLSRLRMPQPKITADLPNPIARLAETGTGNPTVVTRVVPPKSEYNGTQCHVFFDPIKGAKIYDVWVSVFADGRGAVPLGQGWTEPGSLLTKLRANTNLYLFVVYTDAEGKTSKPSPSFKVNLKDMFPMK